MKTHIAIASLMFACSSSLELDVQSHAMTGSADTPFEELPVDAPVTPDDADDDDDDDAPQDAPPEPKPTSRVEVSYFDGNPTSMFPVSPSVTTRCWIPKEILDDTAIYAGDPKMTHCDVITKVTGEPPTSVSFELYCGNGPGAAYDYFRCSQSVTLVPPSVTNSGFFSYGNGKSADLDAKTCDAYLKRALSICEVTGKVEDLD